MSRIIPNKKFVVICRGYGHSNSPTPTYYGTGSTYRNFTTDLIEAFVYDTHKEAKEIARRKLPPDAQAIPAVLSDAQLLELFKARLRNTG